MFWFFAAALVVLAVLFVLLPLWKIHRAGESGRARREQTNLLIFQERIAELESEIAAFLLEMAVKLSDLNSIYGEKAVA